MIAASGQLSDSQELVTLSGRTQNALTLAHSLADERDEVTSYIAAGRPESKAPSEQRGARVDRQVEELRTDTGTPAGLRADLEGIATVRRAALTGQSTALEAHEAYSAAIADLHRLAEELAEQLPPRAGSGAYALAELDTAVQQAAATRGLLLAALSVPSSTQTVYDPVTGLPTETSVSSEADGQQRDALTAAAQTARLRSESALADFHDTATQAARGTYDSTVTGPEVNSADEYLAALTDQPTLSDEDLGTGAERLNAALTARIDLMRGVEASLYERRTTALEQLRDDDVTALEIQIAILGALMLLAVGVATGMARSLTRPLAVLRLGSARLAAAENPAAEEPVKFTGRNDEFAQVVRSVNALHAHAAALHERITTLESDRKHLVGQRQKMADAREELRTELADSAAQLERLRDSIGGTFVNLALRTLGLVERQLGVIEGLEEREQDPERLATLFKLDHFATVMRRHSENLLVLAGTEHVQQHAGSVPVVDVVRAAVSEIERYERVRITALPPHAHLAGFAADDLSHLLAELLENATSFSPPDLPVEVSGWLLESGEVMLSVQDGGHRDDRRADDPAQRPAHRLRPRVAVRPGGRARSRARPVRRRPARPPARGARAAARAEAGRRRGGRGAAPVAARRGAADRRPVPGARVARRRAAVLLAARRERGGQLQRAARPLRPGRPAGGAGGAGGPGTGVGGRAEHPGVPGRDHHGAAAPGAAGRHRRRPRHRPGRPAPARAAPGAAGRGAGGPGLRDAGRAGHGDRAGRDAPGRGAGCRVGCHDGAGPGAARRAGRRGVHRAGHGDRAGRGAVGRAGPDAGRAPRPALRHHRPRPLRHRPRRPRAHPRRGGRARARHRQGAAQAHAEDQRARGGAPAAHRIRRRRGPAPSSGRLPPGAEAGRRDVESEIAERTGETTTPSAPAPDTAARDRTAPGAVAAQTARTHAHAEESTGGTVEEASS
ncbi:hypothetical protein GCM10020295_26330 [Streptomyces cinereospinus]